MSWTFAGLRRGDLPLLHEWLGRPHVAEWWDERGSLEELADDFADELAGRSRTRCWIASRDGRPAGFVQCYVAMGSGGGWWEAETDPGVRGIDQFLADGAELGQGRGAEMIGAFTRKVFLDPEVTRIQADPQPDNARAIRCYEKVGFRRGEVVQTPDGLAQMMTLERGGLTERSEAGPPEAGHFGEPRRGGFWHTGDGPGVAG